MEITSFFFFLFFFKWQPHMRLTLRNEIALISALSASKRLGNKKIKKTFESKVQMSLNFACGDLKEIIMKKIQPRLPGLILFA